MRPRIKSVTEKGRILPVIEKVTNGIFRDNVVAVKVSTSGTREQIERKFKNKLRSAQAQMAVNIAF